MLARFLTRSLALATLATLTHAQIPPPHDECTGALPLTLSGVILDNLGATDSLITWPCGSGGADVWYRYVATSHDDLEFSTCSFNTTFDTIIEVFTGDCSNLVSVGCDDDSCSPFRWSTVRISNVTPGIEYYVRVGGHSLATGIAELLVNEIFPLTPKCLEVNFDGFEVGALGGAIYFDLRATIPVTIFRIALELDDPLGAPVDIELWTRSGTHVGHTDSPAGWQLAAVDVGGVVCRGPGETTWVDLTPSLQFGATIQGVAVIARTNRHRYVTVGVPTVIVSGDGALRLTAGAAGDVPFAPGTVDQRAPALILCYDTVGIGSSYCDAEPNSTGATGLLVALGSEVVTDNDVTLKVIRVPQSAFGIFLTGLVQGAVVHPGGSQGTLCLGSGIGRFVRPGQVQQAGADGTFSLSIDLTQIPQPTGPVSVMAGEVWSFQAWYRDAVGGSATSNFTDGLEIHFR